MSYDYPDKELWNVPMMGLVNNDDGSFLEKKPTFLEYTWASVTMDFDMEAHINSPEGEAEIAQWKNVILYADEMDPHVLDYYRGLGYEKTLHEAESYERKWALYTPLSSFEDKDRTYPLYIVLHGGNTAPYEIEGYGYIEACYQDEPIVMIPHDFTIEGVLRVYQYAVDHLPVDLSRVYCTSYCGGARSRWVAMRYPEIFAAIAPAGNPLRENYKPIMWYPDYERLRRIQLPCMHLDGLQDLTQLLPVWQSGDPARSDNPDYPGKTNNMPLAKREYKVNCLRDLLYSFDCRDVTAAEVYACENSADPVLRATGAPGDETEVRDILGRKHYFSKFRNSEGDLWLQIVGIDSMGHFPNATLGKVAWEFLRRFRRDPVTGIVSEIGKAPAKQSVGEYDHDRYQHDWGSHEYGYNSTWKGHGK